MMYNNKCCLYGKIMLWTKIILCTVYVNVCPLTVINTSIPEEDGESGSIAWPGHGDVHIHIELTPDYIVFHQALNFSHRLKMKCDVR